MKKPWKLLAYGVCGLVGIWLTAKVLLPVGLPFLLGYLLSRAAAPAERLLRTKARFPRWLASFLSVTAISAVLIALLWLLGRGLFSAAQRMGTRLPGLLESMEQPLQALHAKLLRLAANLPASLAAAATTWIDRLFEGGSVVAGTVSERVLSFAGSLLSWVPNLFLFILTALLSAYLFSSQKEVLQKAVHRHLPESWLTRFSSVRKRLKIALGGYFKAQGCLLLVTFSLLTAGLLLLRRPHAVVTALVIALIDALPVFGVGAVLIPWGILSFLQGDTTLAVGLLLLYAVSALCRTVLEPRFMGRQMGLNPLLTLLCLYAGFRLFGVLGMILVPLAVILLKQLYDLLEAA